MNRLLLIVLFAVCVPATVFAACTATVQTQVNGNPYADYSETGTTSATVTTGSGHFSAIKSVGDLVVFTAWCYQRCTPGTLTMGSQTATRTSVSTPGTTFDQGQSNLFTGQGFLYYILSSTQSGNQTITWSASNFTNGPQTQVSYIDFGLSAGCTASHSNLQDSGVASANNTGVANGPSISGVTGDVLVGVVVNTQHVNPSVGTPWSCPTYGGANETGDCTFNNTKNGAAYILAASSGTTSMNWNLINGGVGWESIISPFAITAGAANACPSGVPAGVTTCYFVANSGSGGADTNTGADEAHPWLHAPGMSTCVSACLTIANTISSGSGFPGLGIIMHGGDTWFFNTTGTPHTGITPTGNGSNCDAGNGCGWVIGGTGNAWSGTVAHPMYFGVDLAWPSSGWSRPIMNGGNATSTSGVSSCPTDQSGFSFIKAWTGSTNFIIDNFEFTGMCWSGANNAPAYIDFSNVFQPSTNNRVASNNYMHGWTHVTFSCSAGPSGNCDGGRGFSGASSFNGGIGDTITNNVIDGADSDPHSFSAAAFAANIVQYNVFRNLANGTTLNNNHSWHDNMIEFIGGSGDGVSHSNGVEMNTESHTVNVFYNNLFRNFFVGGVGCGNVQVWRTPQTTDYAFNNLIYNFGCGTTNYWDLVTVSQGGADNFTDNEFNNTFVIPGNGPFNNSTMDGTPTINFTNNHCISTNGGATGSSCHTGNATYNYSTNTIQTTTVATGQGFTASETFAYSPASGAASTVGAGANKTSTYCNTLAGSADPILAAAGAACKASTGYACTYNSTSHSVSCPATAPTARPTSTAWDTGAYEFSGNGPPPTVSTPTFSPVAGTYTSQQSVTLSTTTGGATICYTTNGFTPTTNGAGACTGSTLTYSVPVVVLVTETIKAVGSLNGDTDSVLSSALYTINIPPGPVFGLTIGIGANIGWH